MIIHPFAALRATAESAQTVASMPYDVVEALQARQLAAANPDSFLHVIRSEVDLPDKTNPFDPAVYDRAAENLQRLQTSGKLVQEDGPSLYVYRMTMADHSQLGLLACCSVDQYDSSRIKKHELTRADKEDDRTNHIVRTRAQCGPVLITYQDDPTIEWLLAEEAQQQPLLSAASETGVRHDIWRIADSAAVVQAFARLPHAYIADGHHRSASASRARARFKENNPQHTGDEEYNFFLAALFPASQMKILAYNRVVSDLEQLSGADVLSRAAESFEIRETDKPAPDQPQRFCVYLPGQWYQLTTRPQLIDRSDPVKSLDCSLIQNHFIEPLLGISELRTDPRIRFIGGTDSIAALQESVDGGQAALAISMYPTSIDQLMAIADAGQIMPPKSTWFEPKLRSGLLIHML